MERFYIFVSKWNIAFFTYGMYIAGFFLCLELRYLILNIRICVRLESDTGMLKYNDVNIRWGIFWSIRSTTRFHFSESHVVDPWKVRSHWFRCSSSYLCLLFWSIILLWSLLFPDHYFLNRIVSFGSDKCSQRSIAHSHTTLTCYFLLTFFFIFNLWFVGSLFERRCGYH